MQYCTWSVRICEGQHYILYALYAATNCTIRIKIVCILMPSWYKKLICAFSDGPKLNVWSNIVLADTQNCFEFFQNGLEFFQKKLRGFSEWFRGFPNTFGGCSKSIVVFPIENSRTENLMWQSGDQHVSSWVIPGGISGYAEWFRVFFRMVSRFFVRMVSRFFVRIVRVFSEWLHVFPE